MQLVAFYNGHQLQSFVCSDNFGYLKQAVGISRMSDYVRLTLNESKLYLNYSVLPTFTLDIMFLQVKKGDCSSMYPGRW